MWLLRALRSCVYKTIDTLMSLEAGNFLLVEKFSLKVLKIDYYLEKNGYKP